MIVLFLMTMFNRFRLIFSKLEEKVDAIKKNVWCLGNAPKTIEVQVFNISAES